MGGAVTKRKPESLSRLIGESIRPLPEASVAFYTLATAGPQARPGLLVKLRALGADADSRHVKALRKSTGSFKTPLNHEDVLKLAEAAVDYIDQLGHVAILLVGYKMGSLPKPLISMSKALIGAAEELALAAGLLKKHAKFERHLSVINKHLNDFKDQYRALLIDLLATDAAPNPDAARIASLGAGLERANMLLADLTRSLVVTAGKE